MEDILEIPEQMTPLGTPERPGLPVTPGKDAERMLKRFHELFGTPPSPPRKQSVLESPAAPDTPTGLEAQAASTPGEPQTAEYSDLLEVVPKRLIEGGTKRYRISCNNGRKIVIKIPRGIDGIKRL
ncbi:uncharacterized protein LOC126889357 [Diabrotica virgifera virgifera]|uniref:Uncharacterized protein LOC114326212 n=1 Tax=Diabrotica virgifera virgifera TaxID=50390 RepID=A0A6P7FA07_DIAVI|nr:uncharacterized protein LOC126882214 [Diabrotica virgifera virgifera]XP_050513560.1 uncharacterized protein LOC126889357 [Diabrotica virgifera virgifera]